MPLLAELVARVKNQRFDALPQIVKDIKQRYLPPPARRNLLPPPRANIINPYVTNVAVGGGGGNGYTVYVVNNPYLNQGTVSNPFYLDQGTATGYLNMATASSQTVWTAWNTTTNTTATSTIWYTWNNGATVRHNAEYRPPRPAVLTPDQAAEEQARRAEERRRYAAEQAARKAAEDIAQELLLEHLTPEQLDYMKKHHFFVVEGGKSKHKYRIWTNRGVHGNVEKLLKNGQPELEYCVQLRDTYRFPNADHFLAQKLMLELAEDDIINVANVSRRYAA